VSLCRMSNQIQMTKSRCLTLYLDSNILFALLIPNHQFHDFVKHLLAASCEELHIKLAVHKRTLDEFHKAVEYQDCQFVNQNAVIRDLIRICAESDADPAEEIEEPLIADFLRMYPGKSDLQMWNRFVAPLRPLGVKAQLEALKISVDTTYHRIPDEEYQELQDVFMNASVRHMRSGPKRRLKQNTGHDAFLYRYIYDTRKAASDQTHVSYDRYLFSLDGSLPTACQLLGIPLEETFFLFPNQWYELVFPFLRVDARNMVGAETSFANMLSGVIFPALRELIPIDMYDYVFRAGGDSLPFHTAKQIALQTEQERRQDILARRDPRNTEQIMLSIQRRVVEARVEADKSVIEKQQIVKELQRQEAEITARINELSTTADMLMADNVSTSPERVEEDQQSEPTPLITRYNETLESIQARIAIIEVRTSGYFEDRIRLLNQENDLLRKTLSAEKDAALATLKAIGLERERASMYLVKSQNDNACLEETCTRQRIRMRVLTIALCASSLAWATAIVLVWVLR